VGRSIKNAMDKQGDILKLKKAWIVRWTAHGDEERILSGYGLTNKVIDFLSIRHDFDKYIWKYAENIYKQRMLSLSEKFLLSHYNHQKAWDRMFGSAVPVFTHYSSEHYKKMMRCVNEKEASEECVDLRKNWEKYPVYIVVGHNPSIEIKKVFNLELETKNGLAKLTWDEPLSDGTSKHCEQETTDLI